MQIPIQRSLRVSAVFTALFLAPLVYSQVPEGLELGTLRDSERQELMEFTASTRRDLQRALDAAATLSLGESGSHYRAAIVQIVDQSHSREPRLELLSRISLNQGLEVANAVSSSLSGEVSGLVLEHSVRSALGALDEDQQALQETSLRGLPFVPFARGRLQRCAGAWLGAIPEASLRESVARLCIKHFLATVSRASLGQRMRLGSVLLEMDSALSHPEPMRWSDALLAWMRRLDIDLPRPR